MTGALFLGWRRVGRWAWARFAGGSLAAFLLTLLVFFGDAKIYLFDVLPKYAKYLSFGSEYLALVADVRGRQLAALRQADERRAAGAVGVGYGPGRRARRAGDGVRGGARGLDVRSGNQLRLQPDHDAIPCCCCSSSRRGAPTGGLLVFGLFAIIGDRRLFMTPGATILTPNFHFVAGAGLPGRRGAHDRARPRGPAGGARAGLAQRTTNQRTAIACRCSTRVAAARSRT